MKFNISSEELKNLVNLTKISSAVADAAVKDNLYIVKVDSNKLYTVVYGNGNIIQNFVNIESLDNVDGYFYIDISKLIQAVTNVMMSQGTDVATVDVETNKLIVSSKKSKVSVSMFDSLDDDEYEEAFTSFDTKKTALFTNPDNYVIVRQELINLASSVNKYISMFPTADVSGVLVEGNNFYYSDQSISIVHKPMTYEASKVRKVIPQTVFPLLTSLVKSDEIKALFSDSDQYMLVEVPELNFKSIVSLPAAVCEYPDDNDYFYIAPDENNKVEFDVDIPTLQTKLSSFDGIFQSSMWKWKQIDFELLNGQTSARLYHESAAAELEVDLQLENVVSNTTEDLSFRFASAMLYDYIKSFVDSDNDKLHISVSPLTVSSSTPHSAGIEFTTDDVKITLCKIMIEDVI